jgi:hypothetical protein
MDLIGVGYEHGNYRYFVEETYQDSAFALLDGDHPTTYRPCSGQNQLIHCGSCHTVFERNPFPLEN